MDVGVEGPKNRNGMIFPDSNPQASHTVSGSSGPTKHSECLVSSQLQPHGRDGATTFTFKTMFFGHMLGNTDLEKGGASV